ncbi:MAG: L-threonylcarbamoyladenylate synthase [Solirubrobacterales bacterium]|jgi:L-threonylcarbamoyladenylate synthase|nr:L-threonylcarbamoyladenylate synthase [Solirubrobacterales bacterium]
MSERLSIEADGADAVHHAFERVIADGGVAVFPADGLYGLACDPTNGAAIKRIHELKNRETGKPSAVMYFSQEAMGEILESVTPIVRAILSALLPGPVTLVLDNPEGRYPLANGEAPDRLGVRLIDGPLSGLVVPVFQTSANRSGEPPPARAEDVHEQIASSVDLVIDGGELTGEPSTVVDLTKIEAGGSWDVLREGALSYGDLESKLTGLQLGG